MKRVEKIALLTKILHEGTNLFSRQRLQQLRENPSRSLIIIDDMNFDNGRSMMDDDLVHFYDKGKRHQMTLREANQYARRFGVGTIFILPAKH